MGLFDFLKKKVDGIDKPLSATVDRSEWTGKDFEFLIRGEIDLPATETEYDRIMTPNSLEWIKESKNEWPYYRVGNDEFTYSWEMPGIQMTFNEEINFQKAKKIADEVVDNIRMYGQQAELVVIDATQIYRFE
jgi:hypothetical protein